MYWLNTICHVCEDSGYVEYLVAFSDSSSNDTDNIIVSNQWYVEYRNEIFIGIAVEKMYKEMLKVA